MEMIEALYQELLRQKRTIQSDKGAVEMFKKSEVGKKYNFD